MPAPSTLLLFAVASLALLAIPGPAVVYLVTRSVTQGRTAGLVSVLGVETGTFAYAIAAAAGVTGLVAASQTGFTIVRFAGAAYLVHLGVRRLLERGEIEAAAPAARSRLFLRGLVVQLLNPKIAVFFLAFLPQFVDPDRGSVVVQSMILGTLFTALAILGDGAYVMAADAISGRLRRGGGRGMRRLARISGGVYIGLGVTAALSGSGPARGAGG
jgi:threonine/homoserine/homoserine lactone efflux protein